MTGEATAAAAAAAAAALAGGAIARDARTACAEFTAEREVATLSAGVAGVTARVASATGMADAAAGGRAGVGRLEAAAADATLNAGMAEATEIALGAACPRTGSRVAAVVRAGAAAVSSVLEPRSPGSPVAVGARSSEDDPFEPASAVTTAAGVFSDRLEGARSDDGLRNASGPAGMERGSRKKKQTESVQRPDTITATMRCQPQHVLVMHVPSFVLIFPFVSCVCVRWQGDRMSGTRLPRLASLPPDRPSR